ncbi:hypothetical protein Dda_0245 [Drechslerella dactyloides]|uniref:Uncharacterized protein n=1 Tax=Drechslerella dactyloides TaxID=74499 RepID=A0AAD6J3Z3_DREDA|nr:hypothetical protein Dda_0245 [Drechslerella dactyloides]
MLMVTGGVPDASSVLSMIPPETRCLLRLCANGDVDVDIDGERRRNGGGVVRRILHAGLAGPGRGEERGAREMQIGEAGEVVEDVEEVDEVACFLTLAEVKVGEIGAVAEGSEGDTCEALWWADETGERVAVREQPGDGGDLGKVQLVHEVREVVLGGGRGGQLAGRRVDGGRDRGDEGVDVGGRQLRVVVEERGGRAVEAAGDAGGGVQGALGRDVADDFADDLKGERLARRRRSRRRRCSGAAMDGAHGQLSGESRAFNMATAPRISTTLLRASAASRTRVRGLPRRRLYSSTPSKPDYAFAFDIDGVLLRGHKALPGATAALRKLADAKVPFILLTNGGGHHESHRTATLSRLLDHPITEDMFIQSHTPFKSLTSTYRTVLAVGGPEPEEHPCDVGDVAKQYGFKNVYTPHALLGCHPEIWPFDVPSFTHRGQVPSDFIDPVDAILVFNDPRHWGPTLHLMIDLLLSERGALGTYSSSNGVNGQWQNDGQPTVWWSNNDLWWQGGYHLPRLGQGGFRAAVEGVWRQVTRGAELKAQTIGKPFRLTYEYAEGVLNRLLEKNVGAGTRVKTVYMVGDNPRSDIEGANAFGWCSLLVESGVFHRGREGGEEGLVGALKPARILAGVEEAVDYGMQRGGVD